MKFGLVVFEKIEYIGHKKKVSGFRFQGFWFQGFWLRVAELGL